MSTEDIQRLEAIREQLGGLASELTAMSTRGGLSWRCSGLITAAEEIQDAAAIINEIHENTKLDSL